MGRSVANDLSQIYSLPWVLLLLNVHFTLFYVHFWYLLNVHIEIKILQVNPIAFFRIFFNVIELLFS